MIGRVNTGGSDKLTLRSGLYSLRDFHYSTSDNENNGNKYPLECYFWNEANKTYHWYSDYIRGALRLKFIINFGNNANHYNLRIKHNSNVLFDEQINNNTQDLIFDIDYQNGDIIEVYGYNIPYGMTNNYVNMDILHNKQGYFSKGERV